MRETVKKMGNCQTEERMSSACEAQASAHVLANAINVDGAVAGLDAAFIVLRRSCGIPKQMNVSWKRTKKGEEDKGK